MTTGWLPWLGAPLSRRPLVASATALAISPGIPALLARTLERRWLRPRREFTAFIYGDPLLALAIGTGVYLSRGRPPAAVGTIVGGRVAAGVPVGWLAFGLWQWRAEVRSGVYLPAQAGAPTKIWHQVVTYPVLGYLGYASAVAGLATPAGARAGKALVVACGLTWSAALAYDRRHPKLGHPPFEWRRLRPRPDPLAALVEVAAGGGRGRRRRTHPGLQRRPLNSAERRSYREHRQGKAGTHHVPIARSPAASAKKAIRHTARNVAASWARVGSARWLDGCRTRRPVSPR